MAGPAMWSSTEKLPDEVIVKVLTAVVKRRKMLWSNTEGLESSERDLLRAMSTCRRWLRLGRRVSQVDCAIVSVPKAVSLVDFILQEAVLLSKLHLFISQNGLDAVPMDLVLTGQVRKKVPETVHVSLIGPKDNMRPIASMDGIISCLMRCPKLTELELSGMRFGFIGELGAKPTKRLPPLKVLVLKNVNVTKESLKSLITECTLLEDLHVSFDYGPPAQSPRFDKTLEIHSASLKSLVVLHTKVKIVAPALRTLRGDVRILALCAAALDTLSMDAFVDDLTEDLFNPSGYDAPNLRELRLHHLSVGPEWWNGIILPVLDRFGGLQVLELNCSTWLVREAAEDEDLQKILVRQLLRHLPSTLNTLKLTGAFLDLLERDHGKERETKCPQIMSCISNLKIDLLDFGDSYFHLRSIVRALPGLTRLEIHLAPEDERDDEVRQMLKEDFGRVSKLDFGTIVKIKSTCL